MTATPEPDFAARSAEVGMDRAAYEYQAWQDQQREAALNAVIESSQPAS